MTLKNKNTYNILLTGIITAVLITSGIGVAYAAAFPGSNTFGTLTTANGLQSSAFGTATIANGYNAAAFGQLTAANGDDSAAFGHLTTTSGAVSATFGVLTTAQPYASFVIGKYNEISGTPNNWVATDPLFVIGNGDSDTNRNNAVTVLKNGNMGIGISAPTELLQVAGIIESTTGGFMFPDATTQTTASVDTTLDQTGIESLGFVTGAHTIDTQLWTQSGSDLSYTTGNVGIGTITPSADLEIRGTGNAIVWDNGKGALRHHYDALTWDRMWFNVFLDADNNQDSAKFQIFNDVSSSSGNTAVVSFGLDNQDSWIDSGNVGIGTTTPNSALQVTGYIQLDTSEGTPPSADCDASDEYGRMKVDSRIVSSNLYVCTPSGWAIK